MTQPLFGLTVGTQEAARRAADFGVDFVDLHLLRETLRGLTGDGDHLIYRFGQHTACFSQAGGNYPRHEIMGCFLPLTQAGTNPDILEVEIKREKGHDPHPTA